MEQHERGAGGRRAGGRVVDRVPAERRSHLLGLEVLGEVLGRRGAEEEERVGDPRCGCARRAGRGSRDRQLARRARGAGSGGVVSISGVISSAISASSASKPGSALASAAEKRANSSWVSARSSSSCSERAVGEEVQRRARRVDLDPALDQLQVAPDRLAQHAQHVGAGRGAVAGRELLGHAAAADDLAALADDRPQARASRGSSAATRPLWPPPTIAAS